MSKATNHIPLWLSLIGLVTHRILLAMMDVFYAVIAETYSSLDLKERGNS